MRRGLMGLIAVFSVTLGACQPSETFCRQRYDCQTELGIDYEDDYIEICKAQQDANQEILRASTESECTDLANAELALMTCLANPLLSCDEFADFTNHASSTVCREAHDFYRDALAAADEGRKCDGIDDDAPPEPGVDAGSSLDDAGPNDGPTAGT